ncbi:Putative pyrimidine permease RutG [Cronobacter sakazakii]|nr:Putative pyrimidine permease RutG [Cronobacter sakazakii]
MQNHVDLSQNGNLIMVAVTLVLGAGDFALTAGGFTLGGIGTATFGAIALNALLSRKQAQTPEPVLAPQEPPPAGIKKTAGNARRSGVLLTFDVHRMVNNGHARR